MITENIIKVENTPDGILLTADTEKCHYGQAYNITDKTKANYVESVAMAKQRFMKFYNNFEAGKRLVSGADFKPLFV